MEDPAADFCYNSVKWGIWKSPTSARFYGGETPACRSPCDYGAPGYADTDEFLSGGPALGSSMSSYDHRRPNNSPTQTDLFNGRSRHQLFSESPRPPVLSGQCVNSKSLLASLPPIYSSKLHHVGPNTSLLDQFASLADATRHMELTHHVDGLNLSDSAKARYQGSSSSTPSCASPIQSKAALSPQPNLLSPPWIPIARQPIVPATPSSVSAPSLSEKWSDASQLLSQRCKVQMSETSSPQSPGLMSGRVNSPGAQLRLLPHISAANFIPIGVPPGAIGPAFSDSAVPSGDASPIGSPLHVPKGKFRTSRKKDWKRTKRSENQLLEDLKTRPGEMNFSDILGSAVEVSMDQHGSRFIQERFAQTSDDVKEAFFRETESSRLQLVADVFGNYVIQQFLERGTPKQRHAIVTQMKGKVFYFSLQMYGCRVVQMALKHSCEADQVSLVQELETHVVRCIKDHNGNHVIQKAIEYVDPRHVQFIYRDIMERTLELSKHTYGCRVVQRILEHGDIDTRRALITQLSPHITTLVEDQYGNYVVQHIVNDGMDGDRAWVLQELLPRIVPLSCHKYASNVIERCFVNSTPAQRSAIISHILSQYDDGTPMIITMIKDQYANYVVQKILDISSGSEYAQLASVIRPYLPELKHSFHGKHLACIERLLDTKTL